MKGNLDKLKPCILEVAKKLEAYLGTEITVTSGYRDPAKNMAVGGVKGSAHTLGYAVDISCTDSATRFKIVAWALAHGVTRVGVAKTFVHMDTSPTHPQSVLWLY